MSMSRSTFFVAVHLFLLNKDQIFLARRFQTGYEDGKYSVPAGHVEPGESPTEAAIREAYEEADVHIKPQDLELVHVMHRIHDRQSVDFFFVCRKWQGEPCINEPDKCDEVRWVSLKKLPKNTIPYIRLAIQAVQDKKIYSEATC